MLLSESAESFNGIMVTKKHDEEIILNKQSNIDNLTQPTNQKEFASQLKLSQYIWVYSRPDVCENI